MRRLVLLSSLVLAGAVRFKDAVDGIVTVPLKLPADMPLGDFGITIAQTWRNDIRIGMPGPCTTLVRLTVIK